MKLRVERKYLKPNYTIGKMYLNDVLYCDTLEPTYRDLTMEKKIEGKTAIPCGTYRVVMSYSNRFKRILPELLDVSQFEGVRIHPLNYPSETQGCIGVGKNDAVGQLSYSRHFSDLLNEELLAVDKVEESFIEIKFADKPVKLVEVEEIKPEENTVA